MIEYLFLFNIFIYLIYLISLFLWILRFLFVAVYVTSVFLKKKMGQWKSIFLGHIKKTTNKNQEKPPKVIKMEYTEQWFINFFLLHVFSLYYILKRFT